MKEKKLRRPTQSIMIRLLKSRVFRHIIALAALVVSVTAMLLIDSSNAFLRHYLPFLDVSFLHDFFLSIGLETVHLAKNAWYIFACAGTVAGVVLFLSLFKNLIINAILRKANYEDERKEKTARRLYNVLFYTIFFIIAGLVILAYYLLGAFQHFDSTITNEQIFSDLLVILACFGILFVGLILSIFIISLVFKFVAYVIAVCINTVRAYVKRLEAYRLAEIKKQEEEKAATEATGAIVTSGVVAANGESGEGEAVETPADSLFPSLVAIDNDNANGYEPITSTDISLEEFVLQFQSYAINKHKIYYELPVLRAFIAGMAVSRLIVLEGLSGTGKSMLPRMFCEFTNSRKFFAPVQSTWRDKSDLLGFYSEFTKSFKSTDFLANLYGASYTDKVNMMVLDEMNISRIEYYFADFLSILEYPAEDWKVRVYEPQIGQGLPKHLPNGYISIPTNTWFVGTANTDDSTFTITDKVYDRAMIIDFKEKISPIESSYNSDEIQISADKLCEMFEVAKNDSSKNLNDEEKGKFLKICDFMRDSLDVRFGNRIMVQIENFVPVYVALGGDKEHALDYIFSTKVLRKLEGIYEDYVKDELATLLKLIQSTYGKGTFVNSERIISKIMKRLV